MWHSGARVRISPTAVLLVAVFALMAPTVCLAAVLLAAVCHEMGHYIALRLCGGRLEGLSVSAFGAQMRIRDRNRLSYGREALCVLAGPLVNVTLSWLMRLLWIGIAWVTDPFLADKVCRVVTLVLLMALAALGIILWLRHRAGFLLLGTAGVVCCTVREFALANPVGTG